MDADSVAIHVAFRDLLEPNGCCASWAPMDCRTCDLLCRLRCRGKKPFSRLLHPSHCDLFPVVRRVWSNHLFDRDECRLLASAGGLVHLTQACDVRLGT